jgi:hypothetical protein
MTGSDAGAVPPAGSARTVWSSDDPDTGTVARDGSSAFTRPLQHRGRGRVHARRQ